jgi:hypothetical protein
MKNNFNLMRTFVLSAMFFGSLMLTSCSKSDDDNTDDGKTDPSTIAAANLVAYFPFDAADETVQKANNTITYSKKVGAASFVTGRRNKAYQGSTSEAYLEYNLTASNPFITLDEYTIAVWIKTPVTTSGAAKIFGLNGGDSFMGNLDLIQESQATGDSVDMKMYLYDSESPDWKGQELRIQKTPFLNDKWFHFVAIYRKSTSTMEFYTNGKFVTSSIKYAGPVPTVGDQPLLGSLKLKNDMTKIYFGAWAQQITGTPDSWMTYYKGMLDEFRVYNKALTETEISDLYNAEVSQINVP